MKRLKSPLADKRGGTLQPGPAIEMATKTSLCSHLNDQTKRPSWNNMGRVETILVTISGQKICVWQTQQAQRKQVRAQGQCLGLVITESSGEGVTQATEWSLKTHMKRKDSLGTRWGSIFQIPRIKHHGRKSVCKQNQLHNLHGPMQNENAKPLFKEQEKQSIKFYINIINTYINIYI